MVSDLSSLPLPALWGIVAWRLGRKPLEPEGIAVLNDRQRLSMDINLLAAALFIEEELNTFTVCSGDASPVGHPAGKRSHSDSKQVPSSGPLSSVRGSGQLLLLLCKPSTVRPG